MRRCLEWTAGPRPAYGVQVDEPFKGTAKWSHFVVKVFTWDGVVAYQKVFYLVVRILKPAHTRALIESLLEAEIGRASCRERV